MFFPYRFGDGPLKSLICPLLEYYVQAWSPHEKKYITLLENVQRGAIKMDIGLGHLSYEERIEELELTNLEDKRSMEGYDTNLQALKW